MHISHPQKFEANQPRDSDQRGCYGPDSNLDTLTFGVLFCGKRSSASGADVDDDAFVMVYEFPCGHFGSYRQTCTVASGLAAHALMYSTIQGMNPS